MDTWILGNFFHQDFLKISHNFANAYQLLLKCSKQSLQRLSLSERLFGYALAKKKQVSFTSWSTRSLGLVSVFALKISFFTEFQNLDFWTIIKFSFFTWVKLTVPIWCLRGQGHCSDNSPTELGFGQSSSPRLDFSGFGDAVRCLKSPEFPQAALICFSFL